MPKKLTIEEMQTIAEERGGKCLSDIYVNAKTKLNWECDRGHTWMAIPDSVKRGNWCPDCAGKNNLNLEVMKKLAEERRGKCLSTEYKNSLTKLLWECEEGHQWEAFYGNISHHNQWCPECAGIKRYTIKEMQEWANKRAGECLSKEYINANTKLKWRCERGHVFESTPSGIRTGYWCSECAGNKKMTIEQMQKLAIDNGGECLSKKYINSNTKLSWKCADGHVFEAKPNNVKRGQWCTVCSGYLGEEKTRYLLEKMFSKRFPKNRIKLGDYYELDGYNEELNLGFEYNGLQHYEFVKRFHKTQKDFEKQINRDKEKKKRIKELKLNIIIIPDHKISKDADLIRFIKKELQKFDIKPPNSNIGLKDFYKEHTTLNELKRIASSRNGECLSNEYVSDRINLEWRCEVGHTWKATPNNIKRGTWCPTCARINLENNKRSSIDEMHEIAKKRGGKCLSKEYTNGKVKLRWQCANGHVWEAKPYHIKSSKSWCPHCSTTMKGTIKEMKMLAEERNGKCLSDAYINNHTKLKWECEKGHTWEAIPSSVKKGSWCAKCNEGKLGTNKRLTIEDMQALATAKNGICLSKVYLNAKSKLKWQCAEGHVWESTPSNIKSKGRWCPKCAKMKNAIEN